MMGRRAPRVTAVAMLNASSGALCGSGSSAACAVEIAADTAPCFASSSDVDSSPCDAMAHNAVIAVLAAATFSGSAGTLVPLAAVTCGRSRCIISSVTVTFQSSAGLATMRAVRCWQASAVAVGEGGETSSSAIRCSCPSRETASAVAERAPVTAHYILAWRLRITMETPESSAQTHMLSL